ncbi:25654_t:CDS:2, partial [Gigaspora margarita]
MSSQNNKTISLKEGFEKNVRHEKSTRLFKFASNQLSHHRTNEALGSLMDVALNNFVELVITIIALANGQIRVVQAAVLGSILFHILLILGLCFLIGGIKILKTEKLEQDFESISTIVQATSSVLTLACISLILPASFSLFVNQNNIPNSKVDDNYVTLQSIDGVVESHKISKTFIGVILLPIVGHIAKYINIFSIEDKPDNKEKMAEYEEKMEYKENTTESEEIMAAKTVNSIRSSVQTAIFITPLLVILGWIINQPMSLSFLPFETVCLFIAVMFRNYLLN